MKMKYNTNIFNQTNLSAMDRLVYILLDCHKNEEGTVMMPYPEIAKRTGVSQRTAIRCIGNLVDAGILEKETIIVDGWGGSMNKYKPILDGGQK